ncbi:hypothetical protein PAHAL_7G064800 [Panicum hallii]|uniref:FBD domain-containing protein n=1 Tax=Panicum hallii TaxID=206008 RepID=A0A2T8IB76_9POAL|nr:hypothetical protein PAHAL_7G064800 [Panicum hallii]
MMPLSLSTVARTMKTSALYISPDVGVVIGLLKCFPCVETLYFESHSPRNINNTPRSDQLECLDHHLKKLVVTSYAGTESEVNFIKFFILNAKVLEFMKIVTHGSGPYSTQELHLEARASRGAEIVFESDIESCSMVHINHIHDMAMDDPFDLSLCRCENDPIWDMV